MARGSHVNVIFIITSQSLHNFTFFVCVHYAKFLIRNAKKIHDECWSFMEAENYLQCNWNYLEGINNKLFLLKGVHVKFFPSFLHFPHCAEFERTIIYVIYVVLYAHWTCMNLCSHSIWLRYSWTNYLAPTA